MPWQKSLSRGTLHAGQSERASWQHHTMLSGVAYISWTPLFIHTVSSTEEPPLTLISHSQLSLSSLPLILHSHPTHPLSLPPRVLCLQEYLKAAVLAATKASALRPYQSMTAGAAAGALSAALTTPLDVVKTRMMTEARAAVATAGAVGAQVRGRETMDDTCVILTATLLPAWCEKEEDEGGLLWQQ